LGSNWGNDENNYETDRVSLNAVRNGDRICMSYLDDLRNSTVLDFMKQAGHRIDGITMYLVCAIFAIFSAYSALAAWIKWPSPVTYWKGFWVPLLLIPITFLLYISFLWFSTPKLISRLINAFALLSIPFYVAYKFKLLF
jgi:hypothetical protein